MCARFRSRRHGVSLAETMVSLLILTIVMITALTLLFSMKSFAERQQVKTAPRQTSRRAVDYLSAYVAGATDLNDSASPVSPNAIVTWYAKAAAAGLNTPKQASYNNLTAAQSTFGEQGTDILTVAFPLNTNKARVVAPWTNPPFKATPVWLEYRDGCGTTNDTAAMRTSFMQATGATGTPGSEVSALLSASDANGVWTYYQITTYATFDCTRATDTGTVQVVANPAAADQFVPVIPTAGQPTLNDPVFLMVGMRYVSFRLRRDATGALNLEQKLGLFDPDTDTPGTAFTPIMPDVEDFQVAYLYRQSPDGSGRTIFNTYDAGAGADVLVTAAGNVPPANGTAWDITNVSGLRLSVTSRSAPLRLETSKISVRRSTSTFTNLRPRSEDRAEALPNAFEKPGATTGNRVGDYDHTRMTATVLIRNRMLGN